MHRAWLILCGMVYLIALTQGQDSRRPMNEDLRQADNLLESGDTAQARRIYERMLEQLGKNDSTELHAHTLNGLSNVCAAEGNYREAANFARHAVEIYHTIGDADGEAYALNNLGIAEGELGSYGDAQAHFKSAIVLAQRAADLETQVRTWNNLGNSFYFPGKYFEAEQAYGEAGKILEQQPQQRWSDYWRQLTQINQATLYQRLGAYQTALTIYKDVEKSTQSLSPSDQGQLLANLGVLYRRLGDSWKALDSYRSALKQYSQQHDSAGEIGVLKNIGIVYALDQNNLRQAERYFNRALSRAKQTGSAREEMQAHLYLGETHFREGNLDSAFEESRLALDQSRKLGSLEDQWKAQYGLGRILLRRGQADKAETELKAAIGVIEASRAQLQPSPLRAEFLADKRDVYDALIDLLLKRNDVKDSFAVLERSRSRNFQDRIATLNASASPLSASDLEEVRHNLPSSSVLLEFWVSKDRIASIWCSRESSGISVTELSHDEQQKLSDFLQGLPATISSDSKSEFSFLSRLIPQQALGQENKHLIIVPDEWLGSVPFDLIPLPGSTNSLLLDRFDISLLPSAIFLQRKAIMPRKIQFPWQRELIAYGDPQFESAKQSSRLENAPSLMSLPYSRSEISAISNMTAGKSVLFLGERNLKSNFVGGITKSAPILHVSTHALTNTDIPEDSRIVFSSSSGVGNPEYLFLRELYDLDLRGVRLATLSACDTERGKIVRGEGMQAFSRALLHAGASSSVTTLWRVQDAPTAEFMQQFYYFALEKHQPIAEALRSAKLKFLRSGNNYRNPTHWAAFVLNGDGQQPLPRFISWRELSAAGIFLVLVIAFAINLLLRFRSRSNWIHRSEGFVPRQP